LNFIEHIKETFKLALPVSIGFLGHVMLGVVDSIMIGNLGAKYLAASSLANSLLILILVLGIGLSIAITPLVAIASGSKNNDECGIVLRQGLLVNMIFSILLVVLSYSTAELIVYLKQPEEVAHLAESYMKILSFSMIPFMLFQTFKQFIEGLGFTKPAMYVNIVANFVNVLGNWILIYGNLGFPRLELDGAGYASLLTRIFIAVALFVYVIKSKYFKEYDASLKFKSINFRIIKKIIGIGVPSGLQMLFEAGAFSFSAIMIGWLGTKYLAAHQIAINLASATFMIILGINSAATIRVGFFLGEKNFSGMQKASFSALGMSILLMAVFGMIFIVFRNFLPTIYINDSEVISLASALLIIAAIFQIFDGTQAVGLGILRGMTDVKIPMVISLIAYWAIGIPLGYYLGFINDLKAGGVWIGLTSGLIIAAVFFTIRIKNKLNKYYSELM
jgi:MATE family multidrug resistance protein